MLISVGLKDPTRSSVLSILPVALLGAVLGAGCSATKGPSVKLVVARVASADGRCASSNSGSDPTVASDGIDQVRVSIRTHSSANDEGTFTCDRLFQVTGTTPPDLKIPLAHAETVDIIAEGFAKKTASDTAPSSAGDYRRVAVGSVYGVSATTKSFPTIVMYPTVEPASTGAFPTGGSGCLDSRLVQPRAFHTATTLPDGEVLFIGGLAASGTDPTAETITAQLLYGVSSAEVYDPATGQFSMVSEPSPGPTVRAFHQATLLTNEPPYQILLVGGVTAPSANAPVFGVNITSTTGPRLQPIAFTTPPTLLTSQAAGAEIFTYDPATKTATRQTVTGWPLANFAAGLPTAGGLAVVGGVEYMPGTGTATPVKEVSTIDSGSSTVNTGSLGAARLGASLTALSSSQAIVLGGGLLSGDPYAELLDGLDSGTPVASPTPTVAGAVMTQFHTATALPSPASGGTEILVTGGFQVDGAGNAVQPPPATQAVHVVTASGEGLGAVTSAPIGYSGGYVADATCSQNARYRPAGWESAVPLSRGRVLITGGAPTATTTCNDCPAGASGLCAIPQASIFTAPSTMAPSGALQLSRFGHTATVLADGNVLVVGGITSTPSSATTRVAADAEVYDARSFVPPVDVTQSLPVDQDDPLSDDLAKDMLLRIPGQQAYSASGASSKAARSCSNL